MHLRYGKAVVSLLAAVMLSPAQSAVEEADITGGRIKGKVSSGIASFKGIPFAAPPVGTLRWKVPQPVTPWTGARAADTFAPACIQPWGEHEQTQPSEDCLYLNVWTAAASARERRPVIVWIHGGGLTGGMSWEKVSDGGNFAREGVVLVTIAYRLGVLGFVAHPELTRENGATSGNYGLHDMIAALQWVQKNIAQFGGDPTRVAVMGGSAGAFAVSLFSASPMAKDLYSRAIAFGGTAVFPAASNDPQSQFFAPQLAQGESQGKALFDLVGARDLSAARAMPPATFMKALEGSKIRVTALRDGVLVQGANRERFNAGQFNDTPILIGYTSDEAGEPPPEVTAVSARADLDKAPCKQTHAAFEAAYPAFTSDAEARALVRKVNRDAGLGWSTWTWARLQTTQGRHPAYVYFFDVHPADKPHGAPHATEYPYVFGNFWFEATQNDRAISKQLRSYLINFATKGDPNGPALTEWKKFDERANQTFVFDSASSSRAWPSLAGVKAFDSFFECAVREDAAQSAQRQATPGAQ
jgi:para-nitrobenzyl esterase